MGLAFWATANMTSNLAVISGPACPWAPTRRDVIVGLPDLFPALGPGSSEHIVRRVAGANARVMGPGYDGRHRGRADLR